MCRSRSDIELFVGLCRSQNNVGLFIGIILDGADHSETRLEFHFEVKFRFLSIWIYFRLVVSHYYWQFLGKLWPRLISPR